MVLQDRREARDMGGPTQLYVPKEVATDSQCPIGPGDEFVLRVSTCGRALVVVPVENATDVQQVSVPPPDPDLVPETTTEPGQPDDTVPEPNEAVEQRPRTD